MLPKPHTKRKTPAFLLYFIDLVRKDGVAIIALIVSLSTAFFTSRSYRDSITQQAIDNSYKTFFDLSTNNLTHWDVSHVYSMPETYNSVKENVRLAIQPLTAEKKAEYLLKERAFATYIFAIFEQAFYQYNEANENGNKSRSQFFKDVLNYFTGRVLRNPRLLYLWDMNGEKLCIYFERATREYYDQQVTHNKSDPLKFTQDMKGPFN